MQLLNIWIIKIHCYWLNLSLLFSRLLSSDVAVLHGSQNEFFRNINYIFININTSKHFKCIAESSPSFPFGFSQSRIEHPRAESLNLDFSADIQALLRLPSVSRGWRHNIFQYLQLAPGHVKAVAKSWLTEDVCFSFRFLQATPVYIHPAVAETIVWPPALPRCQLILQSVLKIFCGSGLWWPFPR